VQKADDMAKEMGTVLGRSDVLLGTLPAATQSAAEREQFFC